MTPPPEPGSGGGRGPVGRSYIGSDEKDRRRDGHGINQSTKRTTDIFAKAERTMAERESGGAQ